MFLLEVNSPRNLHPVALETLENLEVNAIFYTDVVRNG